MALADIFVNKNQSRGTPDFTSAGEAGAGSQSAADSLLNFFSRGADIYSTVKGAGKSNITNAPASPVSGSAAAQSGINFKGYLPWIIGGVLALGVLYYFARK